MRPSAVLAGALCVEWTVFQKVIGAYVIYGGTMIDLYVAAIKKADVILGVEDGGWIALAVVLLGEALTWDKTSDILSFGIAVAAGIAAISIYFWVKR